MPHLELRNPRPDVAVLTPNRPDKLNALSYDLVEELHDALDGILTARAVDAEEALRLGIVSRISRDSVGDDPLAVPETLCGYGKFANLDAASLESAMHLENRSQTLSTTGGEIANASEVFRHRRR